MNDMFMERMWINAPSKLDKYIHEFHGQKVLAPRIRDQETTTVYFTEGRIISMMIPTKFLSLGGWNGKENHCYSCQEKLNR
jgi:hypothetical protein